MKFAIIKERKNPPDRRVVFSPSKLKKAQEKYPEAEFVLESSDFRVFKDSRYQAQGFEVLQDISEADIMIGVKEVPIDALIPNKKYFFFSHTIKKQPYNRKLLRAILDKNIELYDYETVTDEKGIRLIGFGRYAGIVGTYNGIRTWGLKYKSFLLPKAEKLSSKKDLVHILKTINLPAIKILLTGTGKVAKGSMEILDGIGIKKVSIEEYLNKEFHEPVYCNIDVLDYNKRKDGKVIDMYDFFDHPKEYTPDFMRFAKVTDMFIAGHFYGDGAPFLYTRENVKSDYFNISVVADISCDVDGPVATTLRSSTIAEPIYGYDPESESEIDFNDENAIAVMAVDNLPCELPRDASEGFGTMFLENVLPAFFNNDKNGILERAKITENGKLTERFSYLQKYVQGKE